MFRPVCISLAVLFAACCAVRADHHDDQAASQPVTEMQRIDARAADFVRRMGTFLAGKPALRFKAQTDNDVIDEDGQRLMFSRRSDIELKRPNQFRGESRGDELHRQFYFDGKQVSILDMRSQTVAVADVSGTVDEMFDVLDERYGISIPTTDLLYADPGAVLLENVRVGKYVGLHSVDDQPCHHLAFMQDNVDWQIWIAAGEQPLPRKLVVSYKNVPGNPQYSVILKDWDLSPDFSADHFVAKLPEGLNKVTLAPVRSEEPSGGEPNSTPADGATQRNGAGAGS